MIDERLKKRTKTAKTEKPTKEDVERIDPHGEKALKLLRWHAKPKQ